MRNNRAQQEMVGFVLIVVLVVVGLMVFLLISLRDSPVSEDSLEAGNLIDAIMRQTTGCAIRFEPKFDDFENLFKSCHENQKCDNLGSSACDYLNSSLRDVLGELMKSESKVSAYQFDFLIRENGGGEGKLRITEGICNGSVSSAQRAIISGSDSLIIRVKLCS